MKVYTKVVMDWDGNVIEEESYDYDGPVAQCGGGGGSNKSTTVQKADPWAGVQPYLKRGYSKADQLFRKGQLAGPGYFPGQTYVERTPLENQAQMEKLGYSLGPMRSQVANLGGSLNRALDADLVYDNPAVTGQIDAVQRRLNRNLTENALPGIRSGSIAAGQMGGSRQALAEASAIGQNQEAIGDAAAQIYGNAYNTGVQERSRAMGLAPSVIQAQMSPYGVMGDVGEYQRGEKELQLQEDMARYQYEGQRPGQNLNAYMGLLQGAPWGSTTTGEMPDRGSPIAGAIGGGMLGYGLGTGVAALNPYTAPLAIGGALLGGLFS